MARASNQGVDLVAGAAARDPLGRTPARLKSPAGRAMNPDVETPSFTFRLERVRSLRERAEDQAREELARELTHRVRGEALLREAADVVSAARDTGRDTVLRAGASGADLLAAQAWMERAERRRRRRRRRARPPRRRGRPRAARRSPRPPASARPSSGSSAAAAPTTRPR